LGREYTRRERCTRWESEERGEEINRGSKKKVSPVHLFIVNFIFFNFVGGGYRGQRAHPPASLNSCGF
jgi:hypothetical protein